MHKTRSVQKNGTAWVSNLLVPVFVLRIILALLGGMLYIIGFMHLLLQAFAFEELDPERRIHQTQAIIYLSFGILLNIVVLFDIISVILWCCHRLYPLTLIIFSTLQIIICLGVAGFGIAWQVSRANRSELLAFITPILALFFFITTLVYAIKELRKAKNGTNANIQHEPESHPAARFFLGRKSVLGRKSMMQRRPSIDESQLDEPKRPSLQSRFSTFNEHTHRPSWLAGRRLTSAHHPHHHTFGRISAGAMDAMPRHERNESLTNITPTVPRGIV